MSPTVEIMRSCFHLPPSPPDSPSALPLPQVSDFHPTHKLAEPTHDAHKQTQLSANKPLPPLPSVQPNESPVSFGIPNHHLPKVDSIHSLIKAPSPSVPARKPVPTTHDVTKRLVIVDASGSRATPTRISDSSIVTIRRPHSRTATSTHAVKRDIESSESLAARPSTDSQHTSDGSPRAKLVGSNRRLLVGDDRESTVLPHALSVAELAGVLPSHTTALSPHTPVVSQAVLEHITPVNSHRQPDQVDPPDTSPTSIHKADKAIVMQGQAIEFDASRPSAELAWPLISSPNESHDSVDDQVALGENELAFPAPATHSPVAQKTSVSAPSTGQMDTASAVTVANTAPEVSPLSPVSPLVLPAVQEPAIITPEHPSQSPSVKTVILRSTIPSPVPPSPLTLESPPTKRPLYRLTPSPDPNIRSRSPEVATPISTIRPPPAQRILHPSPSLNFTVPVPPPLRTISQPRHSSSPSLTALHDRSLTDSPLLGRPTPLVSKKTPVLRARGSHARLRLRRSSTSSISSLESSVATGPEGNEHPDSALSSSSEAWWSAPSAEGGGDVQRRIVRIKLRGLMAKLEALADGEAVEGDRERVLHASGLIAKAVEVLEI